MMRKFIIIIMFISSLYLKAHNEFYTWNSNTCLVADLIDPDNCGLALRWKSYYNIPILASWSQDFPILELNSSQVPTDFSAMLQNWPGVSFAENSSGDENVYVRFTSDSRNFPNPNYTGGVLHMVNDGYIVAKNDNAPSACQGMENTWLLLNNCENKSFTWTHDNYVQMGMQILRK